MGRYYETFDPPFFLDRLSKFDAIKVNPNAYERSDDAITADILLGLNRLGLPHLDELTITTHDQLVSLIGSVASPQIANYIARLADRVLGVRSVNNRLTIKRVGAESGLQYQLSKPPVSSAPTSIKPADRPEETHQH
jgi:hypothetical protein